MVEKGKKEKHEEQVQFAAYKQFCDDTTVEKQRAIKEANEMIEILEADIQKYEADAAQLAKEIAKHDEDIDIAVYNIDNVDGLKDAPLAQVGGTINIDWNENSQPIRSLEALREL